MCNSMSIWNMNIHHVSTYLCMICCSLRTEGDKCRDILLFWQPAHQHVLRTECLACPCVTYQQHRHTVTDVQLHQVLISGDRMMCCVYTNVRWELFPFLTPEKWAPYNSAWSYMFCKKGAPYNSARSYKFCRKMYISPVTGPVWPRGFQEV